jgi:peptidoglycan/xylan/chitin deacetylase (PgdA/CDA1 family)
MRRETAGLTIFITLVLFSQPAGAENLVPNPGVEEPSADDPSVPEGWETNSWGDVVAEFAWLEAGASGERSVRVDLYSGTYGDAKWETEPFAVPPGGGEYTISDSYRSSAETTLMVLASGGGQEEWLWAATLPPSAIWTEAIGGVVVPNWADQARILHYLQVPGWLETDNSSMTTGDDFIVDPVPGTMVSVVYDDGWVTSYEMAVPIMNGLGLRGTHFIIADWVDKPGYGFDHMTSPQLIELATAGHEIGSHSLSHATLTELSPGELEEQLLDSKERLESFGFNVAGFAPPGGDYNESVIEMLKQHYDYSRTIVQGLNFEPYNIYELKCYIVTEATTVSQIAGWAKNAHDQGGWLILLYHRFGLDTAQDTFVSPSRFQEHMQYLVDAQTTVLPIGEVLGVWEPQDGWEEPAGDVTSGLSLTPPEYDGPKGTGGTGGTGGGGGSSAGGGSAGGGGGGGGCQTGTGPSAPSLLLLLFLLPLFIRSRKNSSI